MHLLDALTVLCDQRLTGGEDEQTRERANQMIDREGYASALM